MFWILNQYKHWIYCTIVFKSFEKIDDLDFCFLNSFSLSQIERVLAIAEAYRKEAEEYLKSYVRDLKNSLDDKELYGKFEAGNRRELETAFYEIKIWLNSHKNASKEKYESKREALKNLVDPIMMQAYQKAVNESGGIPIGVYGKSWQRWCRWISCLVRKK